MTSSRDQGGGAPGGISIGGPGGIHIDGGRVQIGGAPMIGPPAPMPLQPPSAMPVSADWTRAPGLMVQHSGLVAAGLAASATLVLVIPATLIAVIGLPWLLFAAPGAFSIVLFTMAVVVVAGKRRRKTPQGLDPDVERRLLDLAVASRGRLTVVAVARALAMPLAEADAALSALARSGHVTVDNDPQTGVVVYFFHEIEAEQMSPRRLP